VVAHQLRRPERAREAKRKNRVQVLDGFVAVVSIGLERGDKIGVSH